jgi:hypothetical protein
MFHTQYQVSLCGASISIYSNGTRSCFINVFGRHALVVCSMSCHPASISLRRDRLKIIVAALL